MVSEINFYQGFLVCSGTELKDVKRNFARVIWSHYQDQLPPSFATPEIAD